MNTVRKGYTEEELKYYTLLSEQYPTVQSVCTEIINLQAVTNLPKATEHFMSDLHGEYAAFYHILNNCSGVIREKADLLFSGSLSAEERSEFCTLIYYPEQKIRMEKKAGTLDEDWYKTMLDRLIELCKMLSSKYTRQKVREALPEEFGYILDELFHYQRDEDNNQYRYYMNIIETIINIDNADEFITALSTLVKRLAVDRLHIVGDIFDRGPRADSIMDMLMQYHSVDIQWGNHDIVWMGAAAGSSACIATVVKNSVAYHNLSTLENGYGISLRPLSLFAAQTYPEFGQQEGLMRAISVILLKLEGQVIKHHPEYGMDDRLLLHKINWEEQTVEIEGKIYPMEDIYLPTVDMKSPYALSPRETDVMRELRRAFRESERLHRHTRFLYERGSMYRCYNQNLLFHGCIPLDETGHFAEVCFDGKVMSGKEYLDYCDKQARRAYSLRADKQEKQDACDFLWYLWCGKRSPLFGRGKMTSFERIFLRDKTAWEEPKNPYYTLNQKRETCERILREFGLDKPESHIVNGHVPVKVIEGENPVKAEGKLIVIDGGFCRAYQSTTGLAGYTLIYNSHGIRIMSHQPFEGTQKAIRENWDIESVSDILETGSSRRMVQDTDYGKRISSKVYDLTLLLHAYRQGIITPKFSDNRNYGTWDSEDESDFLRHLHMD